jgi:hypothetical protein
MNPLGHWEDSRTAMHYARASVHVGLWQSEHILAERYLPKTSRVLELGCGHVPAKPPPEPPSF